MKKILITKNWKYLFLNRNTQFGRNIYVLLCFVVLSGLSSGCSGNAFFSPLNTPAILAQNPGPIPSPPPGLSPQPIPSNNGAGVSTGSGGAGRAYPSRRPDEAKGDV